jgi:hypothetical protein
MTTALSGISVGSQRRLRNAIEPHVRAKYQEQLSRATSHLERIEIEAKVQAEIKEELKRISSPYLLWSSLFGR